MRRGLGLLVCAACAAVAAVGFVDPGTPGRSDARSVERPADAGAEGASPVAVDETLSEALESSLIVVDALLPAPDAASKPPATATRKRLDELAVAWSRAVEQESP